MGYLILMVWKCYFNFSIFITKKKLDTFLSRSNIKYIKVNQYKNLNNSIYYKVSFIIFNIKFYLILNIWLITFDNLDIFI